MDPLQSALLHRIETFQFDNSDTRLRFAARLARENGWSEAQSERVLREYKRFCFLAMEAGHPVTPSEDVDQAWHLHLVYTRSYWGEFCPNVLGQPLHHGPTKGGNAEAVKHDDWYRFTLASYERFFGEPPPADIWPDSATRFNHDIEWTRVNQKDNWIIPKPKLRPIAAPLAFAAMLSLVVGCADGNPLNWTGPEFLALYGLLLVAIVGVNLVVRSLLRGGSDPTDTNLTPYELGYLQGGKHRLFLTVLTDLVRRGHILTTRNTMQPGKPLPSDADLLDQRVKQQIESRGLRKAAARAKLDVKPLHESLAERGLVVPTAKAKMIVFLNVLPLFALLMFGFWKMTIGVDRGKSVEFLAIFSVVTLLIALATLFKPFRTAAGRRLLANRSQSLQAFKGGANSFGADNAEVAMAVALFGVAALELGAFDDLREQMRPLPGSGHNAGGSGGCSSSGCSSGDGGGGGCGGCGGGGD